jgi:hypothetical protein
VALRTNELPENLSFPNGSLHQLAGTLQRKALVKKPEASMSWREPEREHWVCMGKRRE